MYRITLDNSRGGVIKSLIAKKLHNKEFIEENASFGFGELRGYFYEQERFRSSMESPCQIKVLEDNGIRATVEITGSIASHPYIHTISLVDGQERIDFDLVIHWNGNPGIGEYAESAEWSNPRKAFYDDRFKLNILFPATLSKPQKLYKNAPFDVCESTLDNTFYNRWDSIKHNIILNWVDLVQEDGQYGMALFSDHTTSYTFGEDFPLGMTAQYSGRGLWGADYRITGPLKMKYAVLPHEGKWEQADLWGKSNSWNEPLIASFYEQIEMADKAWIETGSSGYEITAVRQEGDNLLVRLFNPYETKSGQQIAFDFPLRNIREVELNGKRITEKKLYMDSGKNFTDISIPQFGIKTFIITR